ncbi:glucosaminidase domain-containing protein [Kurthia zopfii]|uniref:glucosaminidase domain-containing protein n=1 Tax=Kurthia zopfii TaxID=1650 RepID=UPI000F84A18E|nr:glucosaminidase domain-containing protein [Kurthia zopfii]
MTIKRMMMVAAVAFLVVFVTSGFTSQAAKETQIAELKSTAAKFYKTPSKKAKYVKAQTTDLKRSYYVRESKKADGTTYYRLEKGATSLGWVETKYLNHTSRTVINTQKKTMYLMNAGFAYTMPATTSANRSYNLSIRRGNSVGITRYEKLGNAYWYKGKIAGTSKTRWIHADNLTNNGYVGLNLRKSSNVTTKQLQQLLLSKGKTPDNILYRLAPEFIKAQKSTGVNAQFMFAHAALETGWGSSVISQYKNNFFGYQAYDTCPTSCAQYFPTGEEGLKFYASKIVNNYLTSGGPYYNGMNVLDMNVRYATDKDWGGKIAYIMNSIKPYDANYYAKVKASTKRIPVMANYSSEIPVGKPRPDRFEDFLGGVVGNVTADQATVYAIPYIYGQRLNAYKKGTKITLKGYHSDVKEFKNSAGKNSRWLRVKTGGREGWVRSDQVKTTNLAFTNIDANLREDAGTSFIQVSNAKKNTPLKLVLKSGKPVTKKDKKKAIWYQIYEPKTKKKAWIRTDLIEIYR